MVTVDEAGFDPGSDRPPSPTGPNINVVNIISSAFITKTQRRAEQLRTTNVFGSHRKTPPELTPGRPSTRQFPGPRRAADAGPVVDSDEVTSDEGTLPPDYEEVFRGGTSR